MTRDQTGAHRRRVIRLWLYAVAAMVLAGGATRLTESGLSITEWQPAMGALPPLGDAQWLCEFQAALGISTLLLGVPLPPALPHQAMAMVVLTVAVLYAQQMTRRAEPSLFRAVVSLPTSSRA